MAPLLKNGFIRVSRHVPVARILVQLQRSALSLKCIFTFGSFDGTGILLVSS